MNDDTNREVAARLDEVANLLDEQGANPYRVQAYRRAAATVRALQESVADIAHKDGIAGLDALPGIGPSLARSVRELVVSGRLPMLERLRGESDPIALLTSVPGIGKIVAKRLHDELGIESLEGLEQAAWDGRLASIGGVGIKRLAGIRDSLATRLGRMRRGAVPEPDDEPSVSELLGVDREYRVRAARGELRMIAPRRFNPTGEAWLPVLHTSRGERHYTALFSNTARAHQSGATRDWVVLYYDGRSGEHQNTVITARYGPLAGRRIVRGREPECERYYATKEHRIAPPPQAERRHFA